MNLTQFDAFQDLIRMNPDQVFNPINLNLFELGLISTKFPIWIILTSNSFGPIWIENLVQINPNLDLFEMWFWIESDWVRLIFNLFTSNEIWNVFWSSSKRFRNVFRNGSDSLWLNSFSKLSQCDLFWLLYLLFII